MIENVLTILKGIDVLKETMIKELRYLEANGYAKWVTWDDGCDVCSAWVLSENRELLSLIWIDGFTDDAYFYEDNAGDIVTLPKDHPAFVRIRL